MAFEGLVNPALEKLRQNPKTFTSDNQNALLERSKSRKEDRSPSKAAARGGGEAVRDDTMMVQNVSWISDHPSLEMGSSMLGMGMGMDRSMTNEPFPTIRGRRRKLVARLALIPLAPEPEESPHSPTKRAAGSDAKPPGPGGRVRDEAKEAAIASASSLADVIAHGPGSLVPRDAGQGRRVPPSAMRPLPPPVINIAPPATTLETHKHHDPLFPLWH